MQQPIPPLEPSGSEGEAPAQPSRWKLFRRALRRNVPAMVSLGYLILIILVAVFANHLAPYPPNTPAPGASFSPPSWAHPFGTDLFGRDIFSRVIYGSRISLLVGFLSVVIGAVPGALLGMIAGLVAGPVEQVIMRITDMALAFPFILLAILILAFFGSGVVNVMLVIGIASIPNFARLTHASTLSLRETTYVEAARASGARDTRLIGKHILPNVLQTLTVYATFNIPIAILVEAGLDYLGLGVLPPTATWGSIINEGRQSLLVAPWESIFPGLVIMVTVLAFNLFGEAVANFLDPKSTMNMRTG